MSLWLAPEPLLLASRSAARRAMIAAAGIPVDVAAIDIDERAVEASAGPSGARQTALMLAQAKAKAAGSRWPGRIVVGADQTLALGQRRFDKPPDRSAARDQLRTLAGRSHELHSAVAVVRNERVMFSHVETARLTMRAVSDRFIDTYLDAAGSQALSSVGAYQLEKIGVHLFEQIEGDHFTILGLPLLALLAFLRRDGSLA
ncbi:MAG TPA: Maf family protein [Xanthobacteraceae bacterium]|jgi:septum formation protein|nr:Maf family protein [Xanthobacteraceae bacterium]